MTAKWVRTPVLNRFLEYGRRFGYQNVVASKVRCQMHVDSGQVLMLYILCTGPLHSLVFEFTGFSGLSM